MCVDAGTFLGFKSESVCGEACSLQPVGESLYNHFHENTDIWGESTRPNLTTDSAVSLDVVVYRQADRKASGQA